MANYSSHQFYYRALEPIHIGTGGYRLGRADKTICREPGTGMPKIPGTSLSGAAKSYAAMLYGDPLSAGAASPKNNDFHPIFYTFGNASDAGGGNAGTVSVGDAHILLFPVPTLMGRRWITSPDVLKHAEIDVVPPAGFTDKTIALAVSPESGGLNIGHLWFEGGDALKSGVDWTPLINKLSFLASEELVLVPNCLMSPIVNSNLEIRTSVAIDPKTGTVDGSKLFSYEAIPRETILFHSVVVDDYRRDPKEAHRGSFKDLKPIDGKNWESPLDVLEAGLDLMKTLGVGGMGTRGFGRLERIPKEISDAES